MKTHQAIRSSAATTTPTSLRSTPRATWICLSPMLVAAAFICAVCAFNLARVASAPAPRNPWESTEVVEAWRSLHGMPVYERSPDGHSTHMYGSLVPGLQGEIFRWVGPNNVSGRVLSLTSALSLVVLLAVTLRGQRSFWYLLVAGAVILGTNNRANQYFAENRPDMTALLFGTAGILLIGYGQERKRGLKVVLGTACLVAGFFFKQTAFIFAAVPLFALVFRWRRPARGEVFWAGFPLAVAIAVILALKVVSPTVYFYMIDVPRAFGLDWPRTVRCFWDLLIDSPLFLILLGECIFFDSASLERDPRVRWIFAALAVTIPFSSLTAGKVGGAANSLLPALLAMTVFCALRLPRLIDGLKNPSSPLPLRFIQGAFVALMMLMSTFPHMSRKNGLIVGVNSWDREYRQAVSLVERLPGKVVCPEDPTIPLYAKGYAGQNIFAEFDTHTVNGQWPTVPPASIAANCQTADYVVDITAFWQDLLSDDFLRSLGFEPAPDLAPGLSCYRIWRRKSLESASTAGSTVLNETRRESPDGTFSP